MFGPAAPGLGSPPEVDGDENLVAGDVAGDVLWPAVGFPVAAVDVALGEPLPHPEAAVMTANRTIARMAGADIRLRISLSSLSDRSRLSRLGRARPTPGSIWPVLVVVGWPVGCS
jgi:hypothetical protein